MVSTLSLGGPSTPPPSLPASLSHRVSDFQRTLHTSIQALVHSSTPSPPSSSAAASISPYDLQQWLRQQLVQCLEAEKLYLQASTPSLPPSFSAAHTAVPSPLPDPRQLSAALHELSLSSSNSSLPPPPRPPPPPSSHIPSLPSSATANAPPPPPSFRRPQRPPTGGRRPHSHTAHAPHSHHNHPHHHHVGHSHAVEVSVRCLPTSVADVHLPNSLDDDEEEEEEQHTTEGRYSPLPPPSSLSFSMSPTMPSFDHQQGTGGRGGEVIPSCPPGCNIPSMSPCQSPSCSLDFGCMDPTPFSLTCDGEDDPLCCFNNDLRGSQDNGLGDEEDDDDVSRLNRLCPSPLSSLCLPMPCDPCSGSVTQTLTTTTTTTVLSSCTQQCHEHDEFDSMPSSPTHGQSAGQGGAEERFGLVSSTSGSPSQQNSHPLPSSSSSSALSTSASSIPSSSTMVSCHQCKLKKPMEQCQQCTCSDQPSQGGSRKDANGKKRCVKKYCSVCLAKHYGQVAKVEEGSRSQWICPACSGRCNCAACTRRKQMDEEEAATAAASGFFHHHHAHVTIHSLPHHSHLPHHHVHPLPTSLRASCHQCKSSKASHSLLACSSRRSLTVDGKRLRDCKKKFCGACLDRWYGIDISTVDRAGWECPACLGTCPCAACRRKGGVGRKEEDGLTAASIAVEEDGEDGSDAEDGASEPKVKRGRYVGHHVLHSAHPHHHHVQPYSQPTQHSQPHVHTAVRHAHFPYGLHSHPHHHHSHTPAQLPAPPSTSSSTSASSNPSFISSPMSSDPLSVPPPFHHAMTEKANSSDMAVLDGGGFDEPEPMLSSREGMEWNQRGISSASSIPA
jgi:hypothetical protein